MVEMMMNKRMMVEGCSRPHFIPDNGSINKQKGSQNTNTKTANQHD
jgi:hypothetical protein